MTNKNIVQRYIITGMSGTGKTALLDQLRMDGYTCFAEPARKALQAGLPQERELFAQSFIAAMLRQSLSDFHEAKSTDKVAFFDRGIPDVVAYAVRFGVNPELCISAAKDHRYEARVFVAPPWPEIFKNDEQRKATYDEYLHFHELLQQTYRRFGYSIIELPKETVRARVEFVLSRIRGSM